jgi:hypothetical protein
MSLKNLGRFFIGQVGWPVLILIGLGFWGMYKISRKISWFFIFAVVSNLALLIRTAEFNPKNYEMINYLAPMIAFVLLVSVAGTLLLLRRIIVGRNAALHMTAFLVIFVYFAFDHNVSRGSQQCRRAGNGLQ